MKNNIDLKKAIDHIEPDNDTRERMLNNIRQKAAREQRSAAVPQNKVKSIPIRSIARWALPAAACLAIVIAAMSITSHKPSNPGEGESNVDLGNPYVSVGSADDFLQQLDISIDAPEGSENISYSILDKSIADIDFDYKSGSYSLRASNQSGDFSGIFGTVIKTDKIDASTDAVLETIRDEFNYYKLTWTDGTNTYILLNTASSSAEDIIDIYNLIIK